MTANGGIAANEDIVHHLNALRPRRAGTEHHAVRSERLHLKIADTVITAELHIGETAGDGPRLRDGFQFDRGTHAGLGTIKIDRTPACAIEDIAVRRRRAFVGHCDPETPGNRHLDRRRRYRRRAARDRRERQHPCSHQRPHHDRPGDHGARDDRYDQPASANTRSFVAVKRMSGLRWVI